MSDILLVYPRPTLDSPLKELALGIMYLGATLEKHGYDVEYHDERFDGDVTKKYNVARVVGVSAMTGHQLERTMSIFNWAMKSNKITMLGGVHCSLLPKECSRYAHMVIKGEGEQAILKAMESLEPGIYEEPFMNPKDYVYPLTEKNKRYFNLANKHGALSFPTSRGCPHKCNFCYNNVFNKGTWRPMPVELFNEHIDRLVKDLDDPIEHIYLLDDNIGKNKQRLLDIGLALNSHNIKWHTSIRPDYVSKEISEILCYGGCTGLLLGIESGSERILKDVIGKDLQGGVEDIKNCARNLSGTGISAVYSFMTNIPTETEEDRKASMDLADWIKKTDPKAKISFYVYAPYPGTKLYETAIREGFKPPETFSGWADITLSNSVNEEAENIYYISGMNFRKDRTAQNFPGYKRLLIVMFELLSMVRWHYRFFKGFSIEKYFIKTLLKRATQ